MPTRFTELVQWRKLYERDARMPVLTDKLRAKGYVAQVLGDAWVVPTLWQGSALPARPPAPLPLVVKARHGCGQIAFVRTIGEWHSVRRRAAGWMQQRYGRWLDEWAYAHVARGVLVEPMIGDGVSLPIDYKLFVFGGRAKYIQVHLGRGRDHRWIVCDRSWHCLSSPRGDCPERPACLDALIAGAERLGEGHDAVRVDLYAIDGQPIFGEMTFYPGSGVLPIDPPELDEAMGRAWLAARDAQKWLA